MDDYDNKIKVSNLFNEIFNNQIEKYLGLAKNVPNVPKESIIFLESANNSIKNSIKLINNDEYVDSLCLLRSSFEAITFSLAIFFDKKTYDVYKCYNSDIYRKVMMEKYKRIQKKDPKFKIPDVDKKKRDLLKPEIMRDIVANHYKEIYEEILYDCKDIDEVKEELRNFYKYLCNFTHPSIVKTYTFKIQQDTYNLSSIRAIFKTNINYCKILLLLALNFLTLKDNMSDICNLYAVLFLTDINLITDVDNLKSLLKKYDEYLYLNITKKYFKRNNKKLKKIQDGINAINNADNINEKMVGVLKDIVIKFDAIDLCNKYF